MGRYTKLKSRLTKVTRGEVTPKEPLDRHTSFGIGGPADFWIEPVDFEDLVNLMRYLKEDKLPWVILGNGTNVLFSDAGFKGVVMNLKTLSSVDVEGSSVIAGAGAPLQEVLEKTLDCELEGFEFTAGIPGTVGGAVVMNAGGKDGEIGDIIEDVTVLNSRMEMETLSREELKFVPLQVSQMACEKANFLTGFTYRNCSLPPEAIIVEVTLRLKKGEKENIKKRISEILKRRESTQPLNYPSAGCIFKNPHGKSAGELIASTGLAGKRIGDAAISTKHANFIINRGAAKAKEVVSLIEMVEQEILGRFGIKLEREVRIIGD